VFAAISAFKNSPLVTQGCVCMLISFLVVVPAYAMRNRGFVDKKTLWIIYSALVAFCAFEPYGLNILLDTGHWQRSAQALSSLSYAQGGGSLIGVLAGYIAGSLME
jgi:uncharacterized membrane protein